METQAGDISAYIPTNVISITDGQIFLESDLFYKNIRPAISVGKSVSRVGGAAQIKSMKQVAGTLKLDLAQFRALESFAAFASDLDEISRKQLARGERLVEILKQDEAKPFSVEKQIISIYMASHGGVDLIPKNKVKEFEDQFLQFVESHSSRILETIKTEGKLTDDMKKQIENLVEEFKPLFKEK